MTVYPLLLTATITPTSNQDFLNLKDVTKRYRQYVDNLIRFITKSDFTNFVFCENSNTKISSDDQKMLEDLCAFYDKKIEFLYFLGDAKKTQQLTRAYGDQEIMEYAVQNSEILSKHEWFYKITWRYWIKNINNVIDRWASAKNVFIRGWLGKNTVHTCFFKTTKSYFIEHFMGKWDQLSRFENYSLERLYYWYIKQSWINMSINKTHPNFSGERGAWWYMDESLLMQYKTKLFAYLGFYNIFTTPIIKRKVVH